MNPNNRVQLPLERNFSALRNHKVDLINWVEESLTSSKVLERRLLEYYSIIDRSDYGVYYTKLSIEFREGRLLFLINNQSTSTRSLSTPPRKISHFQASQFYEETSGCVLERNITTVVGGMRINSAANTELSISLYEQNTTPNKIFLSCFALRGESKYTDGALVRLIHSAPAVLKSTNIPTVDYSIPVVGISFRDLLKKNFS